VAVAAPAAGSSPSSCSAGSYKTINSANVSGSCLTFTTNTFQNGAIWACSPIDLNQSFKLNFTINFGTNAQGGDGMAFLLQTEGVPQVIGGRGGGLGYAQGDGTNCQGGAGCPITPSVAVEFDTWDNTVNGLNDLACHHSSIQTNGIMTAANSLAGPACLKAGGASVVDGADHAVCITWDPALNRYIVYFDGVQILNYSGNIRTRFSNPSAVYWGFTGASGGVAQTQRICSATMLTNISNPACACAPITLTNVASNVLCNGGTSGAINLTPSGGTAPYTYNWGSGVTTEDRTGLAAGVYTVTVSAVNSCATTSSITITQPATAITASNVATNVLCNGAATGAINLTASGGTGALTYNWGSGIISEDRTGLAAGTYTVTVTDANACTLSNSATITQPAAAVTVTGRITNVSCFGGSNGAINITPVGGIGTYTYNWGSVITEDRTNLIAGSYRVTVTDANSCTAVYANTITQPAAITFTTTPSGAVCPAINNGTVSTSVSGGTANYSYLWSNAQTSSGISALAAGTYTVTLTDANSCTATSSASIASLTSSTAPTLSAPTITCPNTTITLTASGGVSGTAAVINWYSGPNGTGTLLGTGSSISYTPATTTTVYANRQGTCNTTADATVVVNTRNYVYAANGTSSSTYCTDNGGWHHFYVGNDIILSLQGNLGTAGTVTVTIRDNGAYYLSGGNPTSCISGWTSGEAQFEMERNWNVQHTGTLSGTYSVRYYFQPAERTAVINAANTWMTTYAACGYTYKYPNPNGWIWYKNQGSPYTAPDYDDDPTFLLLTSSGSGTTANGINWSTMAGISSFSGGTGGIILIPSPLLSVEWQYFRGTKQGSSNQLDWVTESEQNTVSFEVQRSVDGINFNKIGEVNAAGQSTDSKSYQFLDNAVNNSLNYYRLNLIFSDGKTEYSNLVVLDNTEKGSVFTFFPNPAEDEVLYEFNADVVDDIKVELIDVLGRIVLTKVFKSTVGNNNFKIELNDLPAASYNVRATHVKSGSIHSSRIIKK
jgi:hypothetical protein